jgi:hypothetical protein
MAIDTMSVKIGRIDRDEGIIYIEISGEVRGVYLDWFERVMSGEIKDIDMVIRNLAVNLGLQKVSLDDDGALKASAEAVRLKV